MPLPLSKLLSVAIRQAAKPAAGYMQKRAETNQSFRRICIQFATFYHNLEYRLTQSFYDRQTSHISDIPKLVEARAVKLGTTLFGEGIVFFIAAVVIFAEYQRGAAKDAAKERKFAEQILALEDIVKILMKRVDIQEDTLLTSSSCIVNNGKPLQKTI